MAEKTDEGIDRSVTSGPDADHAQLTETIRTLVQVMRQGEIEHLEVSQGDLHIVLCSRSGNSHDRAESETASPASNEVQTGQSPSADDGIVFHHITSPMVGTFYEAPSPGEPPFVRPGDEVAIGQTVAIIEAMKIMNEIVADRPGIIDSVLVEDGEAVEYGHLLFRLRPG